MECRKNTGVGSWNNWHFSSVGILIPISFRLTAVGGIVEVLLVLSGVEVLW